MLHATDQNFARISVRLSTSQQAAEQVAACASVPSFRRWAVHSDLRQAWQAVGGFQSYASCPARLLVLTGTVIRAKFGCIECRIPFGQVRHRGDQAPGGIALCWAKVFAVPQDV